MVSKKYSLKIEKIKKWFFQLQGMEAIEEEIDLRISSERVSENLLYKAKNYREILEVHQPFE
jgi:hypothetical protein